MSNEQGVSGGDEPLFRIFAEVEASVEPLPQQQEQQQPVAAAAILPPPPAATAALLPTARLSLEECWEVLRFLTIGQLVEIIETEHFQSILARLIETVRSGHNELVRKNYDNCNEVLQLRSNCN